MMRMYYYRTAHLQKSTKLFQYWVLYLSRKAIGYIIYSKKLQILIKSPKCSPRCKKKSPQKYFILTRSAQRYFTLNKKREVTFTYNTMIFISIYF